jgi:two-component system NtrC family sensor kinase
MIGVLDKLRPPPATGGDEAESEKRYRRIWRYTVILTLVVALVPLFVMTGVNYYLYRQTSEAEIRYSLTRDLLSTSRSLEFVMEERLSVLKLLIQERSLAELSNSQVLASTFQHLEQAFGGFVDLGCINAEGIQISYSGPYRLLGVNYRGQPWFNEVSLRGVHVSDVFLGYRQFPHFVIAVRRNTEDNSFYVLRATVDMDLLNRRVFLPGMGRSDDVFIINDNGVLQTPSRHHGQLLQECSIPVPSYSPNTEVLEDLDEEGESYVLGYSYIQNTPFILMLIRRRADLLMQWMRNRTELLTFLAASTVLILIVVLYSSRSLVMQMRSADQKRIQVLHNLEYTNKMATIGRLAASVAHEINNPLAIINEKAGLLNDLATHTVDFPHRERVVRSVESIVKSVERCSAVTHRLLGFTRRMDVKTEKIHLPSLITEVMGFLGKEALHRNIEIVTDYSEDLPLIESDRGQLQQIFLNIVNNAFAALGEGGRLELSAVLDRPDQVTIRVRDNGVGISEENLKHIFEPFFSTKGQFGTGLGLSITYDLVQKLGGKIDVSSKVGEGTTFTLTLPVTRAA